MLGITGPKPTDTLESLFEELLDHIDYCGWGDSWERSCAFEQGLPERAYAMLAKIKESA